MSSKVALVGGDGCQCGSCPGGITLHAAANRTEQNALTSTRKCGDNRCVAGNGIEWRAIAKH